MMILLAIGLIVSGFMIGWYVREWIAQQKINMMLKQVQAIMEREREEEQRDTRKVMHLSISKEGEYILVHDQKTGKFLCQGKSHSEVSEILNDKFENTKFMVNKQELKDAGYDHDTF
jgi:hypothetical protein